MNKLWQKIKQIPKPYFLLADIKKITKLDDDSLKVSLHRLVTNNNLQKVAHGVYANDLSKIDWLNFACARYTPSYLSLEWALGWYGILSQKSYALTLVTPRRGHSISTARGEIIYHHLRGVHFWGYRRVENYLIAEPEKAFLDLAYLSLNGYAKFDPSEMGLNRLNKNKLKTYLRRYSKNAGSDRLRDLVRKYLGSNKI